jgi:hypothetical protein
MSQNTVGEKGGYFEIILIDFCCGYPCVLGIVLGVWLFDKFPFGAFLWIG